MSLVTGLHVATIRRGRRELDASLADCPADRIRHPKSIPIGHRLPRS